MQKVIPILLTIGLLLAAPFLYAQQLNPNQLTGTWEGNMKIYAFGVLKDSVDIRLTIAPKDSVSWIWRTDYLSKKLPMTKDYVLVKGDSNCYITREGDGIDLINYVFGNKFYSTFETEGIFLTSSYELLPSGTLIFEVTSGKKKNSVGYPVVTNYSVEYLQRVLLKKTR